MYQIDLCILVTTKGESSIVSKKYNHVYQMYIPIYYEKS